METYELDYEFNEANSDVISSLSWENYDDVEQYHESLFRNEDMFFEYDLHEEKRVKIEDSHVISSTSWEVFDETPDFHESLLRQ